MNSTFTFRLLDDFDDPLINKDIWNELLINNPENNIFMTFQWQKVWWEIFGRGKLLLIVAQQEDKIIAIAPLFEDGQMIFFAGSGGSDYLDFIGNIDEPDLLDGILNMAIEQVSGFLGFRFYHVLENSKTKCNLKKVAQKKEWNFYEEGELPAPILAIKEFPEKAEQAIRKKSLVRHEAWFAKNGILKVEHFQRSEEILPHLTEFFDQHKNRWAQTNFPSLFHDSKQQLFYRRLCETLSHTEWLRFTRVVWQDNSIAFHLGFNFRGNFLWYKPSFNISMAKRSPGEVLLRQLILKALDEQAITFDFGIGDEEFKKRFATNTRLVNTWGLYPRASEK